jgi:benzil reductase ((S)-benzoin forming)
LIYIITGVSRGLGKAIAEHFLALGHPVVGVGRSYSIDHPNFSFVQCDLSKAKEVNKLFLDQEFDGPVTLINNAGIIGEIKAISNSDNAVIDEVLRVNVTSPFEIAKNVYRSVAKSSDFTLVNISSGAANRSIPGWGAYCASKAALNMLSENFYLEELEMGNSPRVYAVAPGVIDTDMQGQIRSSSIEDFSQVENFKKMKEEGVLFSAEEAANRLATLLVNEYTGEVFYDLRNVSP